LALVDLELGAGSSRLRNRIKFCQRHRPHRPSAINRRSGIHRPGICFASLRCDLNRDRICRDQLRPLASRARKNAQLMVRRVDSRLLARPSPVRAYCIRQINRNQAAVLAYDDCVAFPLRSEALIPGLRSARFATADLASSEANVRYFQTLKTMPMPTISRRPNIFWLNIESFRADAVEAESMPHLWSYRDRFQIRLEREHWSGGNATQFGLFSMLTGLSGHHFASFQKFGIKAPLLRLLVANGYRLSGGKDSYFS